MTMSGGKQTEPAARTPLEEQLDLVVRQSAPRKGKAFLMVSTGQAAGTVFPVTQSSLLVGRSLDADVRINEQAISSEHARLEQNEACFTLRDLGSTNGTYVNGQRLVGTVVLQGGDTIHMGSTTFTFVTRESGVPKGTIRLQNPNPEPSIEAPRRHSAAMDSEVLAGPPVSQQTGSISLTDVVRRVRTYWVYARRYGGLIAIGALFGVLAGLLQLWVHPPPGSAWFELQLVSSDHDGEQNSPQAFLGAQSTFRSLPLIKKTLSELGVRQVSDVLASDVQANLTFEPVSFNSKVYRGDYQDSSAQVAKTFLDRHIRVYVDSELDKILRVLRTDAEFDRSQEQQAAERAAAARDRLIAFSDEHPEAVPKDAKLPEQIHARLPPGASAERVQQRIAATRRALRAAYLQVQSKKAAPYLEKVATTEGQIAEARARGLRDQHPEIRGLMSLQASMRAKANALLAAEPLPGEQPLDPQIVALREELAELEGRLPQLASAGAPNAVAGQTVQLEQALRPASATRESLSQLKIQYGELTREYEREKTEHEALMKKRETTDRQLERERSSAEARFDIITPPTPVKRSMFSAMMKRGSLGGMVGLGLALLAASYLELRRLLVARGHIR
jgi:pSer/pThr/pTyr-binding forkhead associated (FHA) protein